MDRLTNPICRCLRLLQTVSCSVEGGNAVYTRDDYRKQLLLMHVLVVALEVEGWNMAPLQFDGLREALKMTTPDVVSR